MYRLGLRRSSILLAVSLTGIFILASQVSSEKIVNTSSECVDVLLVFARGSSQNSHDLGLDNPFEKPFVDEEKEAGIFFQKFQEHLDRDYPHVNYKAVSVHNFPGLYSSIGYPAVPAFSPPYDNIMDAKFSWFPAGNYRESVENGADETAGFIKNQIASCPDQKIVMGGYSQGAQVIGDSLFKFSEEERQSISAVALFGDPKYLASNEPVRGLFDKPVAEPWKRGTASDRDMGSLSARIPYIPADMWRKVYSWCFIDDFVCSGMSGLRLRLSKEGIGAGHTRYATFGVPQAAVEIIQNISPNLYALEKSRGGVDVSKGVTQPKPDTPTNKPIDFMFLVNSSAGMDDVLGQLRLATPQVLPPLSSFFSDVKYGVSDFSELNSGFDIPRIQLRQDFESLISSPFIDPTNQLQKTMISKLAWGTLSGGGVDVPDPHSLAIERLSMEPSWRETARKNLVLITDRPAKDPYTYNICNASIRAGFGLTGPVYCALNPALEIQLTKTHSEFCKNAYELLTKSECNLDMTVPDYVHDITRNIKDAVATANSKNIAVSIVVPHTLPSNRNKAAIDKQLGDLAKATGGLYLTYDVFNQASYSDMMWQIMNHQGEAMRISDYDYIDAINGWGTANPEPQTALTVRGGVPTVLDVSQSPKTFESYKWDFDSNGSVDEQTSSPNTQHTFGMADSGKFITVLGNDADGHTVSTSFPIVVEPYNGPNYTEYNVPNPPSGIKAILKDSQLEVSWTQADEESIVFVGEAVTGAPIVSIPSAEGKVSFAYDENLGSRVQVWAVGETASSTRTLVEIEKWLPPPPDVPTEPIPPTNPPESLPEHPVVVLPDQEPPNTQPPPLQPAENILPEAITPDNPPNSHSGGVEIAPDLPIDDPKARLTESSPWSQYIGETPAIDPVLSTAVSNTQLTYASVTTAVAIPRSTPISVRPVEVAPQVAGTSITVSSHGEQKPTNEITASNGRGKWPYILAVIILLTLLISIWVWGSKNIRKKYYD